MPALIFKKFSQVRSETLKKRRDISQNEEYEETLLWEFKNWNSDPTCRSQLGVLLILRGVTLMTPPPISAASRTGRNVAIVRVRALILSSAKRSSRSTLSSWSWSWKSNDLSRENWRSEAVSIYFYPDESGSFKAVDQHADSEEFGQALDLVKKFFVIIMDNSIGGNVVIGT